jgi:Glycosyltransferase family 28 N-terminal domain
MSTSDMNSRPFEETERTVLKGDVQNNVTAASDLEGHDAPPPYGEQYGRVIIDNDTLDTKANVTEDGRINIAFTEKHRRLSVLSTLLTQELDLPIETMAQLDRENYNDPPPMNIVIQIIGSRGDIQPFIALGKKLKGYGHSVRVATHPVFKQFVTENGLDFFSVGGDPAELMS